MKVFVVMSGGVDLFVVVVCMVDVGYEVVGVYMVLLIVFGMLCIGLWGCCFKEDVVDVCCVVDVFGILFYVWDFVEKFKEDVINDFVLLYVCGEILNFCVWCNQQIKFVVLFVRVVVLGFDMVVIGYYVWLLGGWLCCVVDWDKDQFYVFVVFIVQQLCYVVFLIGDMLKWQICVEVVCCGLVVVNKLDSYDICFILFGNIKVFLGECIGVCCGVVVDVDGVVLVFYDGVYGFIIGQCRGLGIVGLGLNGCLCYVMVIDVDIVIVYVGDVIDFDV